MKKGYKRISVLDSPKTYCYSLTGFRKLHGSQNFNYARKMETCT